MIVSLKDWEYIYGVDLTEKGSETFTISKNEFLKIQSGKSEMIDGEVIDKPIEEEVEVPVPVPSKSEEILSHYPLIEQLNIIRKALQKVSTDKQLKDMDTFIEWVLKE